MFDVILSGGTIYDGSGSPGKVADIAIKDGVIAEIGYLTDAASRSRIDVSGKAVVPGFIDMHSHADCSVPMWPDMESTLGQGITTCFAGHCGMGVAPVSNYWIEQCFESRAFDALIPQFSGGPIPGTGRIVQTKELRPAFQKVYGETLDWGSFSEYLAHLKRVGHGANLVINVGHSQLRQQFLGNNARRAATSSEIVQMCNELEQALLAGASGISFGFDYDSSMYAEEDELLALMCVARRHNAIVTAHMQTGPERRGKINEAFTIEDGFREFLDLGLKSGAHIHISHIYTLYDIPDGPNADSEAKAAVETALNLIESYREKGVHVTWDYLGTQPAACFFFPQLATRFRPYVDECGGIHSFVKSLQNAAYRTYVSEEILAGGHRAVSPFASMNKSAGARWGENLIIHGCKDSALIGHSIGEIADQHNKNCVDTALDILCMDPDTMCDRKRHTNPPEGHYYVLDEGMSFGTDNGCHNYGFCERSGKDMPAIFGTPTEFSGMIEYFNTFRELPFEAIIKRMTGNAALAIGLTDRGFLRQGMRADIVVLDRSQLRSNLDPAHPGTAPDGVDSVFVNGILSVAHKKHLHPRAGAVICQKENR